MLESLDSQFTHNQFTVTPQLDADVPASDRPTEAAEQAIENLLSNAMKYSPRAPRRSRSRSTRVDGYGVVRVHRSRHRHSARGSSARSSASSTASRRDAGGGPQGTGLGLAIVDHVMRGHGGFVRVDSEPGRGSTFTLHFPLYAQERLASR